MKKTINNKLSDNNPYKVTSYGVIGSVITQVLSIPYKIVSAKILGPAGFGIITIINLILNYTSYGQFGITKTLARNIPILYGKNELSKIETLKRNVLGASVVLLIITLLIVLFIYSLGLIDIINVNESIIFFILINIILMRFNAYLKSYSKGENLIDKIALADLIINIISPLSFLLGVLMYELIGIIYAITFINFFIFIIYIYFLREYNFKLNFSLLEIIPIIKISSPLFLNGLLETLLLSVNIILITKYLDAESVGIFAFATAFMFAKKIPFAAGLNNILSRRILVDFGKYGFSRIDIHQSYIIKNQILYMFFHSIFLGIILLLLSLMVPLFLNDYNNSINIMGTVIFGVIVYSISSISKFFLVAIKDFSSITYITLIGILINAIFTISFLTNGYGLNEIALSMSITFIIMTIFYSIRVNKIIKIDPYSSFIFISKIMLSTLCIILSLLFIINYNKADLLSLQLDNITFLYTINIIGQTLLKISIFIIISIITLTFFFPKQKILNNIAKIILRFN